MSFALLHPQTGGFPGALAPPYGKRSLTYLKLRTIYLQREKHEYLINF